MANSPLGTVLNRLRSVLDPEEAGTTDRELLERFIAREEEAAFGELVRRHGPMILGVCRRILGDAHAAEDAFQATFLVLVRRARSVPWRESLGGWLHGTARRVALRARRAAGERRGVSPPWLLSRRAHAAPLAEPDPSEEAATRELRRVLDQELQGLPAKYRAALVLCDLEGKTHEQAARELGWPKGSMAKRLNGARDRLRARLVRRGVAPAAGAVAALTSREIMAAPSAAAALLAMHGGASTTATVLAKGVIQAMWLTKIMAAAALVLTLALVGTAAGVVASRLPAAREAAPAPPENPAPPAAADNDALPIDKAVVYHVGPAQAPDFDALAEGVVVVSDVPPDLRDTVRIYLNHAEEFKHAKKDVSVGPRPAMLAVGPQLNSGDEAVVVSLKRRGEKLDLQLAYTSGAAEGRQYRRNFARGRPLAQVPVDLAVGPYRLTVTWRARKSLPDGEALNVPDIVSTCQFDVREGGQLQSKPVRVNGAEFTVRATQQPVVPAAGATRDVELGLRIFNAADHPFMLERMDAVTLYLTPPDGKAQAWTYERLRTREVPPVTVDAGKYVVLAYPCRLAWSDDGKTLSLGGTDDSAGHWHFDGLRPGKYQLTVEYDVGERAEGRPNPWIGKVRTEPVELEILDARNESKPVRVEGLEFTALAPARVAAPAPGGKTDVELGLRVANVSDKPLTVWTDDAARPRLTTADGKELNPDVHLRRDLRKIGLPVTLAPGESWTWRPAASLQWTNDRSTLMLSGPLGGDAGDWSFTTLHPGKYRLVIQYASTTTKYVDIPVWAGKAETEPVEFEIVAP